MKKLPCPVLAKDETIIESCATELGFVGYALSRHGLLRSSFMHPSAQAARRAVEMALQKERVIKKYNTQIVRAWSDYFRAYFDGTEPQGIEIPLDESSWTPFYRRVYHFLQRLPRGTTISYGDIAAALGSPGASRAVGRAMATNPVPPIVPCHRVIAKNGSLGNYSACGGSALKAELLDREEVSIN